MNSTPHFRTDQLTVAAVLLQERFHLIRLEREQAKVRFVFENSDALQETLDKFWTDQLLCPAQSLLASFKRAKHILYDSTQ